MTLAVSLRHAFPGFALDVGFTAPQGVTALFGRSGSGKTTVVNAVAGLLRPDQGRIVAGDAVLLDTGTGRVLPPHRRRVGYVFQEARLFPHLSVQQNLLYGRWFRGGGTRFDQVVEMLGIGALLARRPATLSGGERQRVAIGRALLSDPQILLMDEPLAALDDARKAEILPWLERLRDGAGLPILYVSHSLPEVARLATTVVVLESGRVLRAGPVAAVLGDPEMAGPMGLRDAGSVLSARVVAEEPDGLMRLESGVGPLWLPIGPGMVAGQMLRVRIAAQDVILSLTRPEGLSALNILPAVVVAVRMGEGPGAMVQLALGDETLLARVTRRSAAKLDLRPGLEVFAVVKSVSVAQADIGRAAQG